MTPTITMSGLATCWIEMCSVPEAEVYFVANHKELDLLTRYPLPYKMIEDRCKEFLTGFKPMIANDNGIPLIPLVQDKLM